MNTSHWLLLGVFLLWACEQKTGFRSHPASSSGLEFTNNVTPKADFSILDYPYFYNGGGVAVADFDQDGLPDVYLTANQGPNRLFRNLGDFRFDDKTELSGVAGPTDAWATGVSVADVNADGLPDLYVCYLGGELGQEGRNQLFLNEGNWRFREAALEFGLDIRGMCTQAAFFDYDRDGDLDCYVVKHAVRPAEVVRDTALRRERDPFAGDQLLRNDGGRFVDVSKSANISGSRLGYGLQVLVSDWNNDGWPDLYICNDFQENDYFYLNQQDGTFREALREHFSHTSRFSMGSDVTDLNGDGQPDLLTLDMKPGLEAILKTAEAPETYDTYHYKLSFGYHHQLPRNALQVSQSGGGYAELSQLAGIDATDWSWSALFADLTHDGREDLFITNGIARRPNDMDYIKFLSDPAVKQELSGAPAQAHLRFIERMPSVPLPNPMMVRDSQGLHFTDMAAAWGMGQPRFSNGAAFADLDLDGDLDLIENTLNGPAGLYENNAANPDAQSVQIDLKQDGSNPSAFGSRVLLFAGGKTYFRELNPVRGFLSSQPARLHVAWPEGPVDSILVRWPDGQWTAYLNPDPGLVLGLHRNEGQPRTAPVAQQKAWLSPVASPIGHTQQTGEFIDFNREPLIPHMLSQPGPVMAVADVNRDGHPDWYLGGGAGQPGELHLSNAKGGWDKIVPPAFLADAATVDADAAWADLDGDNILELVVVSGGYSFDQQDPRLEDRVYRLKNGVWEKDTNLLRGPKECGAFVLPFDLGGDGDIDLLIGGRAVPGSYGLSPRTLLWENDGKGKLTESADRHGLDSLGMLTAAVLLDWDGDGQPELVTAGEWEPVRVWSWKEGRFAEQKPPVLNNSEGWWNHLNTLDLDGDGDMDLLGGNLGWNSDLKATEQQPCLLFVKDFDNNGTTDPILCRTREGLHLPWASRDELLGQLAYLRRKFPSYASYAGVSVENMFDPETLRSAWQRRVFTFSSMWWENLGGGNWQAHALPWEAQSAPIFASAMHDLDGDGQAELLLGGNLEGVTPKRGRYDASQGWVFRRSESGAWTFVPPGLSGVGVKGEIREIVGIDQMKTLLYLRNGQPPVAYRLPQSPLPVP